jgi:hypothetical protein
LRFRHQRLQLGVVLRTDVVAPLVEAFPDSQVRLDGHHPLGWASYAPVSFTITAEDHAEVAHRVGVGGFTDWTRRLLGLEEERLLVSTIATEVVCEGFGPTAARLSPAT